MKKRKVTKDIFENVRTQKYKLSFATMINNRATDINKDVSKLIQHTQKANKYTNKRDGNKENEEILDNSKEERKTIDYEEQEKKLLRKQKRLQALKHLSNRCLLNMMMRNQKAQQFIQTFSLGEEDDNIHKTVQSQSINYNKKTIAPRSNDFFLTNTPNITLTNQNTRFDTNTLNTNSLNNNTRNSSRVMSASVKTTRLVQRPKTGVSPFPRKFNFNLIRKKNISNLNQPYKGKRKSHISVDTIENLIRKKGQSIYGSFNFFKGVEGDLSEQQYKVLKTINNYVKTKDCKTTNFWDREFEFTFPVDMSEKKSRKKFEKFMHAFDAGKVSVFKRATSRIKDQCYDDYTKHIIKNQRFYNIYTSTAPIVKGSNHLSNDIKVEQKLDINPFELKKKEKMKSIKEIEGILDFHQNREKILDSIKKISYLNLQNDKLSKANNDTVLRHYKEYKENYAISNYVDVKNDMKNVKKKGVGFDK